MRRPRLLNTEYKPILDATTVVDLHNNAENFRETACVELAKYVGKVVHPIHYGCILDCTSVQT